MTTQKNQNRKRKRIVKVILGFIIGVSFGFGITQMIKSDKRLTFSIEKTIEENCNCESVAKNIFTVGIQFSKEDGITNKTASYTLKNCKYKGSAIEEASRINKGLKASVKNYESVNIIELRFKSYGQEDLVKIKDGSII